MISTKKCCVTNCIPKLNASFHRISPHINKRTVWLNNLNLPMSTKGRLCSDHFEASDFMVTNGRVYLHSNANPKMLLQQFNEVDNEIVADDVTMRDAAVEVVFHRPIYKEHNYSKNPTKMQNLSIQLTNFLFVKNQKLRRTNRNLHKEIKKLKRKHKLEQKKFENFDKLSEFLQHFFITLMKFHKRKSSPRQYSQLIRKFALSLHYYSPAGYRLVRDEFNCLPHPQTIASWYRVIDGSPGFTNETLDAIAILQENTPFKIVVNIVLDGMTIRKLLRRMGNKVVGYTDLGGVIPDVKNELANETLIFLAVGVNVPFKAPIGYFLIHGLTGIDGGIDEDIEMEEEEVGTDDHYNMDLAQIDEIATKYFSLIKQNDRGGLFFPSDSLYRVAIMADIIFSTALKESGGKMLHRKWTLNRLVLYVNNISTTYSETIFPELKYHFSNEPSHEEAMIESIERFYLKMRMDFLNKTVSANSGKRQKLIHAIHFGGM